MFSPKKILVPTDFSEYSNVAFEQALDIAKQYNARMYLLHVIDRDMEQRVSSYSINIEAMKNIEKESMLSSKNNLRKEIDRFDESKTIEIISVIRRGIPYEEILKAQQKEDIDLIVIASHGKTGLIKYLIGSVAEKVMRGARCPVLLIRK